MTTTIKRGISWRQQWHSLSDDQRIEHMLSNSELYRRVRRYRLLARKNNPVNSNEHISN